MNKVNLCLILLFGLFTIISCDDTEPIEKVTYDNSISALMTSNCTSCHSGATPSGAADLTTYQNVKAYAEDGKLVTRMNDTATPMPPTGLLSQEDRDIVSDWINDGLLEN